MNTTQIEVTPQQRQEASKTLVPGAPRFEQRYTAYESARRLGLTHQQSITYGFLVEDVSKNTAFEYSRAWCPVLMLLDDCTGILILEDF